MGAHRSQRRFSSSVKPVFTRLDVLDFIHGETEESVLTSVSYFVIVEMKHAAVAMKKY